MKSKTRAGSILRGLQTCASRPFLLGLAVNFVFVVNILYATAQDTSWAVDLDRTEGDHYVREFNKVGPSEETPIELVAKHGVSRTVGAEVVLACDSTKVETLTFKSVGRSECQWVCRFRGLCPVHTELRQFDLSTQFLSGHPR